MGNLSSSAGLLAQYPKARQFTRSPVLFASIQLGKNLQGFILNASEGGVCVQTAKEIQGDEPLDLRFQSVRPGSWVQARGRIVWKNESNTVAGLQFIDTDKEMAAEVRNWLAFGESLQELRGNWWPDSPAVSLPARSPVLPFQQPTSQAVPHVVPQATAQVVLPPAPVEALPEEEESQRARPYQVLPEAHEEENDVPVVPAAKANRHTYDYVRPPSGEERKNKLAMFAGAGACVLALLIWFGLSHWGTASPASNEQAAATQPVAPAQTQTPAASAPNVPGASPKASATKPSSSASVTKPVHTQSAAAASAASPVLSSALSKSMPPSRSDASKPAPVPAPKPVIVQTSSPNARPPAAGSAPAPLPAGTSALVLQVGAMSEEANATKLAGTLTTQHFPAFVSKHTDDKFYRVLVGPFPNSAMQRETEKDLQKSGFQTIEKRWTP
jgi:cell division protein FtsN